MKKKLSILIALVMALSLCLAPAAALAIAPPDYDSTLVLENKDYTNWTVKTDTISGVLDFNRAGPTFDFSLTATGLTDGEYSLIYYADKEDRYAYWGGDNPGAVIGTFTSSSNSLSSGDMSVDLGMNLPCPPDANMYDHDYATSPDFYDNAHGAKIWLVPTSVLTGGDLPVRIWPPTDDWLFETELIWYIDTDTGNVVGLSGDTEQIVAISVSPTSIPFGEIHPGDFKVGPVIIVSNVGTQTVVIDATVDPVTGVFKYLKLNGGYSPGYAGLWDDIISSLLPNRGTGIGTALDVPPTYSAQGSEDATLTFVATAK